MCVCKRHDEHGDWRPDVPLIERLTAHAMADNVRLAAIYFPVTRRRRGRAA